MCGHVTSLSVDFIIGSKSISSSFLILFGINVACGGVLVQNLEMEIYISLRFNIYANPHRI